MTSRNLQTRILFGGGWATDFGPTAQVAIEPGGVIRVPYFTEVENMRFTLNGGLRKIEGTNKLNSIALNGGATVRGLFDFWVLGTGASATQHRVCHVGDDVMKDDADGVFTSILASADRVDTSVPSYATFEDVCIIMSDANEAPLKWTGSGNASTLGTNTPRFSFGVQHKNRFWGAGVRTNKSRLYYSEPLSVSGGGADGDWNGVEAGFIDIDPDDGDEIRALASHKGDLFVFKGPYHGSIHRIAGDTPLGGVTVFGAATAPEPFSRTIFVRGLGAAGHNSIFRWKDDLGFIDGRTASIHSLNATAAFGDFREAALSLPINGYLRTRVNKTVLKSAWAASNPSTECVEIALAIDASTDNNMVLCMDYRFEPVRWSKRPAYPAQCMSVVIDQTADNRGIVFFGDTAGFIHKSEQANRSISETTAISAKATMPFIDYGSPIRMKTLERVGVGIQPKGAYNGTFAWSRDDRSQQSTTFDQGGGDVLAGTQNTAGCSAVDVGAGAGILTFSSALSINAGEKVSITGTTSYNGVYTVLTTNPGLSFNVSGTFVGSEAGTARTSSTANFFILGTSTLGGTRFVNRWMSLEEGGEFRAVELELSQGVLDQDLEVHELFTEISINADSTEN